MNEQIETLDDDLLGSEGDVEQEEVEAEAELEIEITFEY